MTFEGFECVMLIKRNTFSDWIQWFVFDVTNRENEKYEEKSKFILYNTQKCKSPGHELFKPNTIMQQ